MIGPMVTSMISPMIKPVVQQFFTPADLFKNGEQGAWYDPSDLTTLFQDSGCTTPVTGDGDPVGCMLDKSPNGNDATQTVAASRPTYRTSGGLSWLEFDGIDDFLVTSSIDFTATDEVVVTSGVEKITQATLGMVAELSTIAGALPNAWFLSAPRSGGISDYGCRVVGSLLVEVTSAASYPAGAANVLGFSAKISTPITTLRIDGADTPSASPLGVGNFGNYPMYLGSRAGSSFHYNGKLFSLVVVDSLLNASDLSSLDSFTAQKSGVTL